MADTVAVIVQQKQWWQSKLVWFNLAWSLSLLGEATGTLQLSPGQTQIVSLLAVIGNIVLRVWFTGAPVTDRGAAAAESGPTGPSPAVMKIVEDEIKREEIPHPTVTVSSTGEIIK